jgi:hypothetical protein
LILTIEQAMRFHLSNLEGGMARMATSITTEARHKNMTWPFVSFPTFEVLGEDVRTQSGVEVIVLCPYVSHTNVDAWQVFTTENGPSWLEQSRALSLLQLSRVAAFGETSSLLATDYVGGNPSPMILDLTISVDRISKGEPLEFVSSVQNRPGGPYFPVWMQTPAPFSAQLINIDILSTGYVIVDLISAVMAIRKPLLTWVADLSSLASISLNFDDHERYHQSLVKYQSSNTTSTFQNPHAPYIYPVYEDVHNPNSPMVAVLLGLLPFDRYLINLLPQGIEGIDAVLSNPCDQVFTYRLNGNSVRILKYKRCIVNCVP